MRRAAERARVGLISLDHSDNDYARLSVLGRDERGRFRAFDLAHSIETIDAARTQLRAMIEKHVSSAQTVFRQAIR